MTVIVLCIFMHWSIIDGNAFNQRTLCDVIHWVLEFFKPHVPFFEHIVASLYAWCVAWNWNTVTSFFLCSIHDSWKYCGIRQQWTGKGCQETCVWKGMIGEDATFSDLVQLILSISVSTMSQHVLLMMTTDRVNCSSLEISAASYF